ncbi:MAG: flagellar hook protein FlgE [Proteobacteria bacterium]|nr:flagellar hook protein FlgE [Pseudomonadota bacterium]
MISSLYSGASGVKTYADAMTVTGSNIANVNTIGFKYNRANFQDLLATSTKQGTEIGQGVKIGNIQNIQTQGSLEVTESETDVAIDGKGFFTVKDRFGQNRYTRAGQFTYDKEGFLSTQEGMRLQVRDVSLETGLSVGNIKEVNILDAVDPPLATGDGIIEGTGVEISANLNSNAKTPEVAVDFENVTTSMYNFSTTVTAYDNKGNLHPLTVAFRKMTDKPADLDPVTNQPVPNTEIKNNWQWFVLAPGEDLEGGNPTMKKAVGGGFLEFTGDGRLAKDYTGVIAATPPPPGSPPNTPPGPVTMTRQEKETSFPNQIAIRFRGSEGEQLIGLNFGKGSNPEDPFDPRTGLDGMTQFAADYQIVKATADGQVTGTLENIHIKTDGTIDGSFTSGNVKALGRLALAGFKASEHLEIIGENMYRETLKSGTAIFDDPGNSGFGEVRSRSLEHSNVELANEFVRMIELQRSFQANAKTVTTSDEITADLVQMKR